MKKTSKFLVLTIVIFMLMQVVLPTISQAVENVKLNIKLERPYNDDNGDGTVGNDIYKLVRDALQPVGKIGEQNGTKDDLNFDTKYAYYCLRGGLGFGSTETILDDGLEYKYIMDLSDSDAVIEYFNGIGYSDEEPVNYNAIKWIADNMYLPRSPYAEDLKAKLLKDAGIEIEDSKLTDDDIEVVQQVALWYFTNYDENGDPNSVYLPDNLNLGMQILQINEQNASNDENIAFNVPRAQDINTLYDYFITNAKNAVNEAKVEEKLELDENLEPTIEQKTLSNSETYVIGPFKINETQKGNIDYTFTYSLKYKTNSDQEWQELQLDNMAVYLSDINGNKLDRTQNLKEMIGGESFYIALFKDVLSISKITDFRLDIKCDTTYYNTTATVWEATIAKQQPVLKVEKEKMTPSVEDYIEVQKLEDPAKEFDLALRKFITGTNGQEVTDRIPKIFLDTLKNGTYDRDGQLEYTATYEHTKEPILSKRGDHIIYTIRVYNEGDIDGYAKEVTDYLCDELEFVTDSQINSDYGWTSEDGKTLKTNYLNGTLIKAYNPNMTEELLDRDASWQKAEDGNDGLYYADLLVECKIKDTAQDFTELPNIAAITEDLTVGETDTPDRDSDPRDLNETELRDYTNNPWIEDDDDYEMVEVMPDKVFDLALRKYITKIETNGDLVIFESREPEIDVTKLDDVTKPETTADYKHRKDPVEVKTGDIVTYSLSIYNEGEVAGRATKIVDQLPTGLEFVEVISGNYVLENYDEETNTVILKETENNTNLDAKEEGRLPSSTTVEIECKVTAIVSDTDQILTNVAWISAHENTEGIEKDRDSQPETKPIVNKDNMADYTGKDNKEDLTDSTYYYNGEQDDDDFEKLVLKGRDFDLALRKYIDYIERKGESVEFESRLPQVDTTPLTEGKETANYIHPKDTLTVKQGDIITYKLRVYNEGDLDGYATEITDYIPEGLGLLFGYAGNDFWSFKDEPVKSQPLVGENGIYKTKEEVPVNGIFKEQELDMIEVVTGLEGSFKIWKDTLKNSVIKHYGATAEEGELYQNSINPQDKGLFYQELEVTCIVVAPITYEDTITNIAEISQDKAIDEFGTEVDIEDRDSKPANVMEDEKHTPGVEENGYTPGEQDDDDFEPIQLKFFDLALRKFITGVNEQVVETRIPEFYIDENGEYKYKHDKTPVEVTDKDDVTYTIRVFNEGSLDGYAEEIEDDIPEGLIFLPENETNKEYGWKMYYYDEEGVLTETDDVEKATVIRTTYLSETNGEINEETGENSNLLTRFDKETMESPDYKDIKVVFKVSQADIPEENDDRIIVNKAHITNDSDDDEDSIPDEWNEGEDDQDKEYIYVQEFDLALYKWVSKTIVTVDGKTTETETGFKPNVGKTEGAGDKYRPNSEPEPIASVTLDKKKLKATEVKFVYNIEVVNEGDISGYATEITDYIPEGLKFVPEDNPLWTLGEDGKITTRALETKILDPGKSETLPVIFTWINDANNLGVKTNIAAITEDYNEKDVDDVDSVPGNEDIPDYDIEIEKEQEDDDDFALVILQLKTGKNITYIGLMLLCVTIISAGAITIKKYVL